MIKAKMYVEENVNDSMYQDYLIGFKYRNNLKMFDVVIFKYQSI